MELRLDGRVALVTGGSRGIGRAIAQSFLEAGASVMITSRSREKLTEAVATLPGNVAWFAANAGDPDAPIACVAATIERFGAVDILVNNTATNPYYGPLVELDAARADKTVQVNIRGLVLWTQAVWEAWMAEHGGTIINISSAGAFVTSHNVGYYNATKAAAVHLTRSLALELGPPGSGQRHCPWAGAYRHVRGPRHELRGRTGGQTTAQAARRSGGHRHGCSVSGLRRRLLDNRSHAGRRRRRPGREPRLSRLDPPSTSRSRMHLEHQLIRIPAHKVALVGPLHLAHSPSHPVGIHRLRPI